MNYEKEIAETKDYLIKLERDIKNIKTRDRIRYLRLLKCGQAKTQKEAGEIIGIGIRQSQRLWQKYRQEGIKVMAINNYQGGKTKIDGQQKKQLLERLKKDDISSLEAAQSYLAQEFGVKYTIGGVSYLFKRLKVKLKTGRPVNIRRDEEKVEEFRKKNIRD